VSMTIGKKWDAGKDRWELLDWRLIRDTVRVLTDGAKEYGDNNWRHVARSRYEGALGRHKYAYLTGEKVDPKSGLSHLAHIVANCIFLYVKDLEDGSGTKADAGAGDISTGESSTATEAEERAAETARLGKGSGNNGGQSDPYF